MKWANIFYEGRGTINIGDVLFPLTIQHLYELMGIPEQNVQRINYKDLGSYDGEPVLLPICSAFMGYHDGEHITCYSPLITPIFLSLNIFTTVLGKEDIAYLKRYAPIGCRDKHTYGVMRKYDIPAYLNGCLTVTMKFHEKEERRGSHVLWVDVRDNLEPYIPEEYKQNRLICSQRRKIDDKTQIEKEVYDAYLEYIRDAKLVITSRLHCAIPCIMAGIPVIFAGRSFEYRYTWMENYIRFYSEEEYSKIDWHPDVNMSLCTFADEMTQFTISLLQHYSSFYDYISTVRKKMIGKDREYTLGGFEYFVTAIENKICNSGKKMKVAIWGVGQAADMIYDRIVEKYDCCFVGLFDKCATGKFRGGEIKEIKMPFAIKEMGCDLLIVTALTMCDNEKEKVVKDGEKYGVQIFFYMDY